MAKSAYETLGVTEKSSQSEIKSAYRKMAKKFHPDLNPGNAQAEKKFKEINSAYEKIESPEARAKYDRGEFDEPSAQDYARSAGGGSGGPGYGSGARWSSGANSSGFGGAAGGFDEDILGSLFGNLGGQFGGGGGARKRGGASFQMPGDDQNFRMDIDFKEAIMGAEKQFTLPGGKSLQTKIPPGIKSGQKLRFAGQGGAGSGGGPNGDVYLEINVRPSSVFRRVDDDLEMDLPVSLNEAILGGEIEVQTVDGSVMLKIPPKVNTGTKLRIRGKGVPVSAKKRGDQYVILKIMLPEVVDSDLEDSIRKWSESHKYNPRG